MILVLLGATFFLVAVPQAAAPAQPPGPDLPARASEARRKGDLATARRLYEEALRQDPQNGPVALALAETLTDLGESRTAEALLLRLVRSLPDRPEPRRALVLAYLRSGKASEALAEAQRALALDPQDPESHFCLGSALRAAGRPGDAISELERASRDSPSKVRALHELALAYGALDDPRTEATFEKVLALAPGNLKARLDFAAYLWLARNFDRGDEEMERVLKAVPSNTKLRMEYAEKLMERGRFAQAASQMERAWKDGARGYDVDCALGAAFGETGRLEEGVTRLREAIGIDPEKLLAHHTLGRLLLLQQKPEEAAREFERIAAAQPGSAVVQLELGRAYETAKMLDKAESAYRQALKLDPARAAAHYSLGTLLARAGRRDEAREHIAAYQAAFRKEQEAAYAGGSRRAELNLGWIELSRGQAERALEQFERRPDDPDALRGAAQALIQLGRDAEAVRKYERAVALAPEDLVLRYELDKAYDRVRAK